MKHLKMLGFAACAAMALMAFAASSASATTFAVTGVKQTANITITATLEAGTSAVLQKTDGSFANTCTESDVHGTTTSFTAAGTGSIGGPVSSLTFSKCTTEKVETDEAGSLTVEWIKGTSNGTLKSSGAKVTVPSPFGKLTCTTGTGTDIGTLTGKATGFATVDIHAVLPCGILAPSTTWDGSYWITSPHNLSIIE